MTEIEMLRHHVEALRLRLDDACKLLAKCWAELEATTEMCRAHHMQITQMRGHSIPPMEDSDGF